MKENITSSPSDVLFSWSGGKDSALALHELIHTENQRVSFLITTVTEEYRRISMHGVRVELLEEQANALGLPLKKIMIQSRSTNEDYEKRMGDVLRHAKSQGIRSVAFGDIFLEDLRLYRENNLARIQMNALFPLWKRDTKKLAASFIELGFKAILTCVDTHALDASFAGREYNEELLADLPSSVDPCGENGEFHSFVYGGPIFQKEIRVSRGEVVLRDNRFCFCDLLPEQAPASECIQETSS